jgi:hypothetical protein
MVTSTTQGVLVEAPTVEPAPGGLLRAFPPVDFTNPIMGRFGSYYESENCGEIVNSLEDAAEQLCGPTAEKEFDEGRGDLVFSDIHTVYAGKTCNLVGGFVQNDAQRLAERKLELTSSIALERHLWSAVFAERAEDLTPAGGAVKPKRGLAILEEYAGERYGVVPVVHGGRQVSVYLAGETLLNDDADQAAATGGALYVNGGGYSSKVGPGGVVAGPNEAWLYITGWITISRGELVSPGTVITPKKNLGYVLAERTYNTTVECLVGAIRVTLE